MGVLLLSEEASWDVKPPYGEAEFDPSSWQAQVSRWLFSEDGGTTIYDIANVAHGSLNSGCSWGIGPYGPWLVTDGVTGIVTANIANGPALNGSWSIVVWLKVLGATASSRKVWSVLAGANTTTLVSSGVMQGTSGAALVAGLGFTLTDKLHQTAYTFDGTNNRLYFDGVQNATSTTAPSTGTITNIIFGARHAADQLTNAGFFQATFYPFTLTAQQIQQNYTGSLEDILPPADRRWPMGAAAAATAGGPYPWFLQEGMSGGMQSLAGLGGGMRG